LKHTIACTSPATAELIAPIDLVAGSFTY